MSAFTEHGEEIADKIETLRELLMNEGASDTLEPFDLLADLESAASDLSDNVEVDQAARDVFLRWGVPIVDAAGISDDRTGYIRPAPHATDDQAQRDGRMLALAAVLTFADYVAMVCPGQHKGRRPALCSCQSRNWLLYHELAQELWLSRTELAEVDQMAAAIRKAIDARWTRRERPKAAPKKSAQPVSAVPVEKEIHMSKPRTAGEILKALGAAHADGDYAGALALIAEGAEHHPAAKLPSGATWEKLTQVYTGKAIEAQPAVVVPVVEAAPVVSAVRKSVTRKKAAPAAVVVVEPVAVVEPVVVEPVAVVEPAPGLSVTIEHTPEEGTRLLGTTQELGKRFSAILGKNGLKWGFFSSFWYIRGSRNGGADMPRIHEAQKALEADGFVVTLDIHTTDADGNVLAPAVPKLGKAAAARLAREQSARRNSIHWHLTCSSDGLPCSSCATVGLKMDTAKVVTDADSGMPVVKCLPCAGDAPVLELPAEPVSPIVVQADEVVAVIAEKSVPAVASALAGLSGEVLVALVLAGNAEAGVELVQRMAVTASPASPRRAAGAARKAAAVRTPRPAPVKDTVTVEGDGTIVLRFVYQDGAQVRHTAKAVRQDLYAKVTRKYSKYGVKIEVNDGRKSADGVMQVRLSSSAEANKRTEIINAVEKIASDVRGVAAYAPAN